MFAAFLATILFSISAISGNRASKLLGGTEANFWRLLCATVLLGLFAHTLGSGVSGHAFKTLFISGCIGFGIGDLSLYQALPRIGSRLSVMLVLCLSSPIAAALEWSWMRTPLSIPQIVCAFIVLLGVAVALAPGGHLNASRQTLVVGTVFGLIAALCQALGAVLSREAFAIAAMHSESIDGVSAAYQRILGGLLITGGVLLLVKGRTALAPGEPIERGRLKNALPLVFLNGLAGPALGVSCYQWALKYAPTGVVLPIVATTPVVIIPLAFWFEHERPSRRSLIGGIIAVLGAVALAIIPAANK